MRGQHDDRAAITVAAEIPDRVATVAVWQADIHEHDVRIGLQRGRQRLSGGRGALDLELGMQGELLGKRAAQIGVVVHDQDSSRLSR